MRKGGEIGRVFTRSAGGGKNKNALKGFSFGISWERLHHEERAKK